MDLPRQNIYCGTISMYPNLDYCLLPFEIYDFGCERAVL